MSPSSHHCNGLPRAAQQRFSSAAEGSLAVSSSCQLTMLQANKLTTMRVGRSVLLLSLPLSAGGEAADRAELPSSSAEQTLAAGEATRTAFRILAPRFALPSSGPRYLLESDTGKNHPASACESRVTPSSSAPHASA